MSVPPQFSPRTEPCAECSGSGEMFEVARMSGEWFDADFCSERCPYCDGAGMQEARCSECGTDALLNDEGECERCHDAHDLPAAQFDLKYRLTEETRGDPLAKNRRAA